MERAAVTNSAKDDDTGEFSSAEFSSRERRRIRRMVRDDDNAAYVHSMIWRWMAVCGGIATSVLLFKDVIKTWLKG